MSEVNAITLGTAAITGASAGIGKVYADRLAARGYDLLLIARRGDRLNEIAADLQRRFAVRVETLVADLAQTDGLTKVVQEISVAPSITMLVNNAGVAAMGPVTQTSRETVTGMVALNITALTALTMAVLPAFQKRNSGTIVNIGSAVGFAPFALVPIYGSTKAYVRQFTQSLQQQLEGSGIRVQLVTPASTVSEAWYTFRDAHSSPDPAKDMSTEDCVDAALKGLDSGELITAPSLQDDTLLRNFEDASTKLMMATHTGQPATRYGLHEERIIKSSVTTA